MWRRRGGAGGWGCPLVPNLGPLGPDLGWRGQAAQCAAALLPGGGGEASVVYGRCWLRWTACCSVGIGTVWTHLGSTGPVGPGKSLSPRSVGSARPVEVVPSRRSSCGCSRGRYLLSLPPGLVLAAPVRRRCWFGDRGGIGWWAADWLVHYGGSGVVVVVGIGRNPWRLARFRRGDACGRRRTFLKGVGYTPSPLPSAYRGKP